MRFIKITTEDDFTRASLPFPMHVHISISIVRKKNNGYIAHVICHHHTMPYHAQEDKI